MFVYCPVCEKEMKVPRSRPNCPSCGYVLTRSWPPIPELTFLQREAPFYQFTFGSKNSINPLQMTDREAFLEVPAYGRYALYDTMEGYNLRPSVSFDRMSAKQLAFYRYLVQSLAARGRSPFSIEPQAAASRWLGGGENAAGVFQRRQNTPRCVSSTLVIHL